LEGNAKITVSIEGWKSAEVKSATKLQKLLAPTREIAYQPVSERVLKTLTFADKKTPPTQLSFAPDGQRLMATHMLWFQSWDTSGWKELVRLEPLPGITVGEMDTGISADASTVIHAGLHVEREKKEIEGKLMNRLRITGQLDVHDSTRTKPKISQQFKDRGPGIVVPSPDGKQAVLVFMLNGEGNDPPKYNTEWWDFEKGTSKVLFQHRSSASFSPDGRRVFVTTMEQTTSNDMKSVLSVLDTKTLKVIKEVTPIASTSLNVRAVSPDGKTLLGIEVNYKTRSFAAVFLDATTLKELDRIPSTVEIGPRSKFELTQFSADSRTVVFRMNKDTIQVWDNEQKKVSRTIKNESPGVLIGTLALNAQGTMLAVVSPQEVSLQQANSRTAPTDPGQASVLLYDLTQPKREPDRIMLPVGSAMILSFSLDGKTLAVGMWGKVCIIDATMKK
jgi:WD40 repeat protein